MCCATVSVEYPATFLQAMPCASRYALSRLFVPVAVTQTSFKYSASPIDVSLICTLFTITTSASLVRSLASSVVENPYFITVPSLSYPERSMSSPIVFASRNTMFIFFLLCIIYSNRREGRLSVLWQYDNLHHKACAILWYPSPSCQLHRSTPVRSQILFPLSLTASVFPWKHCSAPREVSYPPRSSDIADKDGS